jgi:hypothetical protein
MSIDAFIQRLLVLYGTPDSADDGAFIEEYREMLANFDPAFLKRAGDMIRDTHMRRGWPTPAEVRAALRKVAAERSETREAVEDVDEFEWVGREDERFVSALAKARVDAPAYAKILSERGKIKVRKAPRGPLYNSASDVVRDITKRMTGERD